MAKNKIKRPASAATARRAMAKAIIDAMNRRAEAADVK
jgi:hypothetical protein